MICTQITSIHLLNSKIWKMTDRKPFYSNLIGNFITEETYGAYEQWYSIKKWNVWEFFPFNRLTDSTYNRLQRSGLYFRCRAVVIRDRVENDVFHNGIDGGWND